ncbi:transaldolase/EF-hand domain-containing protein [Aquimixticola soesokkakensis]|uniref:Transaldolase/EF-hand domain-containing protein n=1 Tax=Aquimixticola soesokkakensis TaxID=1519096 RepID=A0A1Y5SH08_9RHOB|nr:EF-hand domain-containing protein [Aquimixticola soesokkakensis]SLN37501.1 transaldolase/EF-hand domain-containing protein [Aquimixticola soesokkakensis]
MKRNALISALALTAVLGGSLGAYAKGGDDMQGQGRKGGEQHQSMRGMKGDMKGDMGKGRMGGFDFAAADTNGDGAISAEEMAAYQQAKFDEIDANGDGEVSGEEMTAYRDAQRAAEIAERQAAMIAERDTDGNGTLSLEEMTSTTTTTQTMFERMDRNGDGVVDASDMPARRAAPGQSDAPAPGAPAEPAAE